MSDPAAGVPCMWMRGGTSKGGYFLASDLPADRDRFLLRAMGSPDPRQIDGMGGGDPLTSKVAVVERSPAPDADIDYLFLQVFVDRAVVSDAQNCGNILAGAGPFAIERGLVPARDGETEVRVRMINTGALATVVVRTPGGRVSYEGATAIDGVPGTAAPVVTRFEDVAGSICGALLPTGNMVDMVDGVACTLIDNGMPCIVMAAAGFGLTGEESPAELETDETLRARLETIRLAAGPMMNLDDVSDKSVPKLSLVSPPRSGGAISTRTFIPHRCHASIGVFGAVSVATAALLAEGPAAEAAVIARRTGEVELGVEHPTGRMDIRAQVEQGRVVSAGLVRTARKLFDGRVFA
jgi:4-oxalomesaconate tautomerase